LMLKSGPLTNTSVECIIPPPVAVTVTLKMPNAETTVSADVSEVVVGDNVTLVGFSVAVARPDGTVVPRLTVPENPLDPVTVSVEVPEAPELIVRVGGLGVMLKSGVGTVTEIVVE
jgi:hypothetical protein